MKKIILLFSVLLFTSKVEAQLIPNPPGSSTGGGGGVSSVAMTVPSILTVTGSPITSSGTLAVDTASTPSGTGTTLILDTGPVFKSNALSIITFPSTATINNNTIFFDIDGNGGSGASYQRAAWGPIGQSSDFLIYYRSGAGGVHRTMTIGTAIDSYAGSEWQMTTAGIDSDRIVCYRENAQRKWCGSQASEFYPNTDKTGSLGKSANAPSNVYSYKFIGASTVGPGITGNATLNTGASDTAGKITATASAGSTAVITFGTSWARAPACHLNNETTAPAAVANILYATTTLTTLTVHGTYANNDVVSYLCIGY